VDAEGDALRREHPLVWLEIVGVGMTATIGQFFLTLAFSRGTATKVSVVGLSQVIMVMICELALGWKAFEPRLLWGTIMVLAPVAWLMIRDRKPTSLTTSQPTLIPTRIPQVTVDTTDKRDVLAPADPVTTDFGPNPPSSRV